jgi:hypothetical protein
VRRHTHAIHRRDHVAATAAVAISAVVAIFAAPVRESHHAPSSSATRQLLRATSREGQGHGHGGGDHDRKNIMNKDNTNKNI